LKNWLLKIYPIFGQASQPMDQKVRAALVATLYASPMSLRLGAACGLINASCAAYFSRDLSIQIVAALVGIIVISRIISATIFSEYASAFSEKTQFLERLYEVQAWAYALALGTLAMLVVLLSPHKELHVMACANAIGYVAGISGRNAGRPLVSVGQLVLCCFPMMLGLILTGNMIYMVLGVTMVLFSFAFVSIAQDTYLMLRESFTRAQDNADLAQEMRVFATTDAVTGLANRAGLNSRMQGLLRPGVNAHAALFWLDLDRFKEVNDSLGHPMGDRLLIAISDRLRALVTEKDHVARFGGDEFVIVCPGQDRSAATSFAEKLVHSVCQPVWIDNHAITISASVGIAIAPEDGVDGQSIMQRADLALYQAKVNGRNQYCFYDAEMNKELVRRKTIESELRHAIRKGELELHYQPIFSLRTGKITSFEALIRWNHPERGMLSPAEFISIAEQTGQIITIGNWIIAEACREASRWPDNVSVCVNVSPVQMQAAGAALGVINALRNARIDSNRLVLEITETVFLEEKQSVEDFVKTVQDAGVRLAMDDFGTGYSSLAYIQRYDFSKIKIDRAFVSGSEANEKASAIIRAVAQLAADLHMDVVAEGIEDADQAQMLRNFGCSHGQGFLYSRAVPAKQARAMITETNSDLRKTA
jgi:diguanylate cyclase (GGDEF)-like protein